MSTTNFLDCHIFSLPSQGSIYTLCRLPPTGLESRTRLLVASLRRPVFLLEFNQGYKQSLVPSSKELSFTNLTGHAEIVSITSFAKAAFASAVLGVAYVKAGTTETGQCLNIYTVRDNGSDLMSAEGLISSFSLEINCIPYHLTHCSLANETFLILSGSDYRVHLYLEDSIAHTAHEKEAGEYFPEFIKDFPSVVLWVEFHIVPDKYRLTSVGCECGSLFLFIINLKTNEIESRFTTNLGTSVTSAKFFTVEDSLHLLVTSALLPAVIYQNVLEKDLSESYPLPASEKHDVVTCSLVCDLTFDPQPTVLIGTYGQELLAYRYVDQSWTLCWQKSFSHPVLALDYCDVTGDGVRELVALTTRGVQILQHDLDEIAKIFIDRLTTKQLL